MIFDMQKAMILLDLFATPRERRDSDWMQDFFRNADEASMQCLKPQVFQGPDGFHYFALKMPIEGSFEPYSVNHLLDFCTEKGLGIAMFGDQLEPEWVFRYGDLWSKKCFNEFRIGSTSVSKRVVVDEDRSILVAQPSESYFPGFARGVLRNFIEDLNCMKGRTPQVFMMMDPSESSHPAHLVFNIFDSDFSKPEYYQDAMNRLFWFFPSHYSLRSVEQSSSLTKHFVDL